MFKLGTDSDVCCICVRCRTLLGIIHRVIEFVVREGPMFEAMIMNRELNNPMFRFLFDNQSPAHCYYRWRLFSILQGDHPTRWRSKPFRMFKDGCWWRPPPNHSFTAGLTDEMIRYIEAKEKEKAKEDGKKSHIISIPEDPKKGQLSERQRDRLEEMLRNINPERQKIQDTMVWCIEHADAAEEIVDCITESLQIDSTPFYKKVARLYLLSDILHNCCVKVSNASFYRKAFQGVLPGIIESLHKTYSSIESRLRAEQFKNRICQCFRAWDSWAIYPNDFLISLQNVFLGLVSREYGSKDDDESEGDIDGVPMDDPKTAKHDEDIDGVPIEDVDGVPLEEASVSRRTSETAQAPSVPKFKASKWETVDPEIVQQQAVTTSKWERIEEEEDDVDGKPLDEDEDNSQSSAPRGSGKNSPVAGNKSSNPDNNYRNPEPPKGATLPSKADEERRQKLRELEVKVMKFQDDLESGRRPRVPGETIAAQVELYRKKQFNKMFPDDSPASERRQGGQKRHRHRSSSSTPPSRRSRKSPSPARRSKRSPPSYRRGSSSPSPPSRSSHRRVSPSPSRPSRLIAAYGGSSASDSEDDDYGSSSKRGRITSPLRVKRRSRSRSPRKSKHAKSPSPIHKRRRH